MNEFPETVSTLGSARGVGRATVLLTLPEGAVVALVGRDELGVLLPVSDSIENGRSCEARV